MWASGPSVVLPSCHSTCCCDPEWLQMTLKPKGVSERVTAGLSLQEPLQWGIGAEEGPSPLEHRHLGSCRGPGWWCSCSPPSPAGEGQQETGTLVTSLTEKAGRVGANGLARSIRGGCFFMALLPLGCAPNHLGTLDTIKTLPLKAHQVKSVRDFTQDQVLNQVNKCLLSISYVSALNLELMGCQQLNKALACLYK